jgi:transposase
MKVEQLDDLPILGKLMNEVGLSELFDKYFTDHGHWKGLSGGKVVLGWLLYILSEGDHRLSHVEEWSDLRLNSLAVILGFPDLRSLDFSDDRLGRLLDRFSIDAEWTKFEMALGKKVLQVYALPNVAQDVPIIRTDSFNTPQFRKPGVLFRHGYSKQRRSDQPFCKVMMSTIDPLAIPLAVDIVKGSGTDADHYLPIIERVQEMFGNSGQLYVGDSQLGSIHNRSHIHLTGDYYLCPLNKKQVSENKLQQYLSKVKSYKELPNLFSTPDSKRKPAYFLESTEEVFDPTTKTKWKERRILVYSPDYAKGLINSFTNRIAEAKEKIQALVVSKRGRRNPKTLQDLHGRIESIIKKYKIENFLTIKCSETIEPIKVQKHKSRPEQIRQKVTLDLTIEEKAESIEQKKRGLGWQLYGSNIPEQVLSASKLVKTYRDEYKIEHLFDYLINRDVGLLPIYLKKEERVKGLIRLLSVAMKFSVIIQQQVRKSLKINKEELNGIYPGNKGRKTKNPTTPMLLRVFKGIAVVWISDTNIQISERKDNQKNILRLLKIPDEYEHILKLLKTHKISRET